MKSSVFNRVSYAMLLVVTVLLSGCSETSDQASVSGQVRLDGAPLSAGVILFENSASGTGGSAVVENGSFTISTPLPIGKYAVALQPPPPPAPHEPASKRPQVKLPRHVTLPETSDLKANLEPGENALDFDVTSK